MKADKILDQAAETIRDRAKLRDTAEGERSMARAVAAFNALTGARMSELEGWLFMSAVKMARATAGSPHLDDYVDLAGYAALGAECVARDEAKARAVKPAIPPAPIPPAVEGMAGGVRRPSFDLPERH